MDAYALLPPPPIADLTAFAAKQPEIRVAMPLDGDLGGYVAVDANDVDGVLGELRERFGARTFTAAPVTSLLPMPTREPPKEVVAFLHVQLVADYPAQAFQDLLAVRGLVGLAALDGDRAHLLAELTAATQVELVASIGALVQAVYPVLANAEQGTGPWSAAHVVQPVGQ